MKYASTRGGSAAVSFSDTVLAGVAPDGGLYVPIEFPTFTLEDFDGIAEVAEIAARFLAPFLQGDRLAPALARICESTFSFPIPLRELDEHTSLLELFHGPTAAFKDVGARFLAECVSSLTDTAARRTVLVATSGDTGGAVAAAFFGRPGVEVVILFPEGGVSEEQERQLTGWGGNVRAFAVRGTFDDCQRMVKEAFRDEAFRSERGLLSANSINLGRLLPQTVYYVAASLWHWRRRSGAPGFVVPSGNLGNAIACFWAWRSGLPIRHIALATNANTVIPDFFESGEFLPAPSRRTLANAMDVGNPSNIERLQALLPDVGALRRIASARSVDDATIRETIRAGSERWSEVFCPHTATAVRVRETLGPGDWIVVATARPAKFRGIVEPLVGRTLPLPPALGWLSERRPIRESIAPDALSLKSSLRS